MFHVPVFIDALFFKPNVSVKVNHYLISTMPVTQYFVIIHELSF